MENTKTYAERQNELTRDAIAIERAHRETYAYRLGAIAGDIGLRILSDYAYAETHAPEQNELTLTDARNALTLIEIGETLRRRPRDADDHAAIAGGITDATHAIESYDDEIERYDNGYGHRYGLTDSTYDAIADYLNTPPTP